MQEEAETVDTIVARALNILERRKAFDSKRYRTASEAAEVEFAKALDVDPNCYPALMGLARCYSYRPKMYAAALRLFARAADVRPDQPEPHYNIGLTLLHSGERGLRVGQGEPYEEAIRSLERALDLGFTPKAGIYNTVGTVYFRMGEYCTAVKWFRLSYDSLTVEGGWQPSTFFLAAEAYEKLGDFAQAISWYQLYKEHGHLNDETEIDDRIEVLRRSTS